MSLKRRRDDSLKLGLLFFKSSVFIALTMSKIKVVVFPKSPGFLEFLTIKQISRLSANFRLFYLWESALPLADFPVISPAQLPVVTQSLACKPPDCVYALSHPFFSPVSP